MKSKCIADSVSIGAKFEQRVASYGEAPGSETGTLPAFRKTITKTLTETSDLVHGHSVVSEKFSNFLRTSAGNSVRYEAVNAMLLNEFLKAHRRIEEQEATIARLQKQIDAVTAGLQKVSAQFEVSKPPTANRSE
jgi:hypothetical protein